MLIASTLSIVLMSASLLVSAMTLHYLWRVRMRHDPLCLVGLLATLFGLQLAARAAELPGNLFYIAAPGLTLFLFAIVIWREGLRRFRNAG